MKKSLIWILAAALAAGGAYVAFQRHQAPAAAPAHVHKTTYQCPMHPQIVRDEPGDCPICHMNLQAVEDEHAAPTPAPAERRIVKYRNPMDPKVFSDTPMKDPMGMDYVPVYSDEQGEGGSSVEGHASFTLSEERRQLIGVRSVAAGRGDIIKTLRLPGRVGDSPSHVLAQALEMDGSVLKPGLKAEVTLPGGDAKRARVVQVDRGLDAFSRSFGVLIDLQDAPDPQARPGVYVDVRVQLKLASGVAVPKEAVLDSGTSQWVFIVKEGGRFEPRAVAVGAEGDALLQIRQGVAVGERVATSANFLIDSESRFQAAAQAFSGGGHD